jgi:hypothetical protein
MEIHQQLERRLGGLLRVGGRRLGDLRKHFCHLARRREALIDVAVQRLVEPLVDLDRQVIAHVSDRFELAARDRHTDRAEGLAPERLATGQTLVGHHGEGPQIRAVIHAFAIDLFGAHELGGADQRACLGTRTARVFPWHLGNSEVEHLDEHFVGRLHQEDVGRFDVAMHHAERLRRRQHIGHLSDDHRRAAKRQRSRPLEVMREGLASQ